MTGTVAASSQTLPGVLRARAADSGDRVYVDDLDGEALSYAEVYAESLRWANAFDRVGVQAGDRVLVLLPTSPTPLYAWLGLAWLRAIEVPVNTAYTGRILADVINGSQSAIIVTAQRYLPRLEQIAGQLGQLARVIVMDATAPIESSSTVLTGADFLDGVPAEDRFPPPMPYDIATIVYTSGTTGPSKGVMVPWGHLHATAVGGWPFEDLTRDDGFYSPLPLYHSSGKNPLFMMALCGGRVVMRNRFKTDQFMVDIKQSGATTTLLLGAMTTFLRGLAPSPDDADTPLRNVLMAPLPLDVDEFRKRFGVRVCTGYSMTEISSPITTMGWDPENPASCGRVRPGYQVRVVDDWDQEVAPGEVGELIVRSDRPWSLMAGYWNMPEATLAAWRNQWFHTGDLFRYDESGRYYFLDRKKDAIRRRGENISSFEVEREVEEHPDVAESAAVAVDSEWGENEVKVCVVPRPGRTLSPEDLFTFLADRMPHFMVPRYIEVMTSLPKTPTEKVRKAELRSAGLTATTWDREAAGHRVTRRD